MRYLIILLFLLTSTSCNNSTKLSADQIDELFDQNPKDKVSILFIYNYSCYSCHVLNDKLNPIKNNKNVHIEYYPISNYSGTTYNYTIASLCGKKMKKFTPIHNLIMKDYNSYLNINSYLEVLPEKNKNGFKQCFEEKASLDALKKNNEKIKQLNFHGTPILIVEGKVFDSSYPFTEIESYINQYL